MAKERKSDGQNIPDAPTASPNGIQFIGRPDIQTLYIDKFIFTRRLDGTVITSGIQRIPGVEIEQLRFLITEDHARNFLDNFAKLIDYYPTKKNTPETQIKSKPEVAVAGKKTAKTRNPVPKKKQTSK